MKFITTDNAPKAIGPYSQAVETNGMIYTSGQIGLTPSGEFAAADVAGQMHQVMKNLTAVLDAGGATLNDVVKTTIFLADMNDFAAVNTIYASYFGDHRPVRSTVAVKTLPANALVEIDCIALGGRNDHF
ncbi:MAG TPA: RidA family protein [Epsilonproteobacteria bacterium]|nr:RidA family protein [Campylobacterota bacterium]